MTYTKEWRKSLLSDLRRAGNDGKSEEDCILRCEVRYSSLEETLENHYYILEFAENDDPDAVREIQKDRQEALKIIPGPDDIEITLDSLVKKGLVERYTNADGAAMVRLVHWPAEDQEVKTS